MRGSTTPEHVCRQKYTLELQDCAEKTGSALTIKFVNCTTRLLSTPLNGIKQFGFWVSWDLRLNFQARLFHLPGSATRPIRPAHELVPVSWRRVPVEWGVVGDGRWGSWVVVVVHVVRWLEWAVRRDCRLAAAHTRSPWGRRVHLLVKLGPGGRRRRRVLAVR